MNRTTLEFCEGVLEGLADPPPKYDFAERCIITVVLACITLLDVAGNIIIIVAVRTHHCLRNNTTLFVMSLAVADIGVAIFVMTVQIYQQYNNKEWLLGEKFCLVTTSFDVLLCTVSIFHLTGIAFDLYLTICLPWHEQLTSDGIRKIIVCCWVSPLFISFLPILNKWNIIGIEDMVNCVSFMSSEKSCVFYTNVAFAFIAGTIAFYIPLVLMTVFNWKILKKTKKSTRVMTFAEVYEELMERRAAKTLALIMGCFCVCWCPFFILAILDPLIGYKVSYDVWAVALWLGYADSMFHPFLYYSASSKFRFAISRVLKGEIEWGKKPVAVRWGKKVDAPPIS